MVLYQEGIEEEERKEWRREGGGEEEREGKEGGRGLF